LTPQRKSCLADFRQRNIFDMSEQTSDDGNQPTGATVPPAPGEKSPSPFRDLKCTLTREEFGAVRWAANRAGKPAMSLAEFFRAAVGEKARAVLRAEIARGKSIPPDIAATMDEKRGAYSKTTLAKTPD
jgi:hypothetical protein